MTNDEAKQVVEAALAAGLAKKPTDAEYAAQLDSETKPAQSLAIITSAKAPEQPPSEIELTAEQPQEMEQCQRSLVEWARRKIETVLADWMELKEAYELAVRNKWKSTTLKRHAAKAESEVNYYTKMLAAFEAGYVLVPNMPGALFAVRTDKVCPRKEWRYTYYDAVHQEPNTSLPPGSGNYVASGNETRTHHNTDGSGKIVSTSYLATDFGELEFPFSLSKPRLMEATSRAMALRIFDEFMILPADAGPKPGPTKVTREDPFILGVISNRSPYWKGKSASFMIAWHINTKDL